MVNKILILCDKHDIKTRQVEIETLFKDVFKKDCVHFDLFFVNTPYGNKVICYTHNNAIKGMGNITRIQATIGNSYFDYYLFTTSMIDKSVRQDGAYFEILNAIKEEARQDGVDFILAFPNANAYPILSTLGAFKPIGKYFFSDMGHIQDTSFQNAIVHFPNISYEAHMLHWRLSSHTYYKHMSPDYQIIYKLFDGKADILHPFDHSTIIDLPTRQINNENILMPIAFDQCQPANPKQPIHMTFFPVKKQNINLAFSPILSDVF